MAFDSHVHWLNITEKPEWYTDWPPNGDIGTLREPHLPNRYFNEANGLITEANHLQVTNVENEWIKLQEDKREKSGSMVAWLGILVHKTVFNLDSNSLKLTLKVKKKLWQHFLDTQLNGKVVIFEN